MMANLLRLVAIVAITLLGNPAFAQHSIDSGAPGRSEDHMLAEAMWSLVYSGASDPVDVQSAFDDATEAYATLKQSIDDVRKANRQNRRSRGIFLVVDNGYMGRDIADTCFGSGYIGKRDPCIVAFTEVEVLEGFRRLYSHVDVRIAQILGTGEKLGMDDIKNISKKADLVVVPVSRLFQDDGQVAPYVLSTKLEFIAIASPPDQLKFVEGVECIVGTAPLNLISRRE